MARKYLFILLTLPTILLGQKYNDSLRLDNLILKSSASTKITVTEDIANTLSAVDKYFKDIVFDKYKFYPKKITVLRDCNITIRQTVDNRTAINIILNDTSTTINFKDIWAKSNKDTADFVQSEIVKSTFESDGFVLFPKTVDVKHSNQLVDSSKNIAFYNKDLNKKVAAYLKAHSKERGIIEKYLLKNVDTYSEKKGISSQSVCLRFITLDTDRVHAGIDIYGAHVSVAFDKKKWAIISIRTLWVY